MRCNSAVWADFGEYCSNRDVHWVCFMVLHRHTIESLAALDLVWWGEDFWWDWELFVWLTLQWKIQLLKEGCWRCCTVISYININVPNYSKQYQNFGKVIVIFVLLSIAIISIICLSRHSIRLRSISNKETVFLILKTMKEHYNTILFQSKHFL